MISRGRIQLRGRIRWWLRRARTRREAGASAVDRLPVVFGNAIPKNGSTLLFNVLRGLTGVAPFVDTGLNSIKPYLRGEPTPQAWITSQLAMLGPGDIRFGYLHATQENLASVCRPGWAPFQIVRDPRDSVVSGVFYALQIHTEHILNEVYRDQEDMETRLSTAIQGIPDGRYQFADIGTVYARYLLWLEQPEVCVVRFEDLVGESRKQLGRILDHLKARGAELAIPREAAIEILHRQMDPAKSDTFRKGKRGAWQAHFTERNKVEFKAVTGDLLIRLGYERDLDW